MSRSWRWGWITVLVLALVLRLAALGAAPLAPDEAAAALASLDAVRGDGWAQTADSPLLLAGNALHFALFGAGNGIARLLPALVGVALVGVMLLWRRHTGDVGALVAAGLLLFSPLALFASRQVDSTILGLVGAWAVATALLPDDGAAPAWWKRVLVTAGLAVGLTGGPAFYDALISGVLAWVIYCWMTRTSPVLALRDWTLPVVAGVVGALLISVGLGLRWNGWSGIGDGVVAWLSSWRGARTGMSRVVTLGVYEPLTVLLALLGLVWAIKARASTYLALATWALTALLLGGLRPGTAPETLLAAVIPLALLGGYGVQQSLAGVPSDVLLWTAGQGALSFVFWQPVGLTIAGHANNTTFSAFIVVLGGVTLLALQAMIAMLFSLSMPPRHVWRGVVLGLGLTLLVVQFGFAWGLGFVRPASPAEPAIDVAASPDLIALHDVIDGLAVQSGQRRDVVEVTVVADDPAVAAVVRWTLRDFSRVHTVEAWPAAAEGLVVASPDAVPPQADARAWQGMRFVATVRDAGAVPACEGFSPPSCYALARWYLYRKGDVQPVHSDVILWSVPQQ